MKLTNEVLINILSNLKMKLISKSQLVKEFCNALQLKKQNELENIISNLRRNGWIKHVFQNYYYILESQELQENFMKYSSNEAVFAVLNKLNIDWYLGLESALIENKLSWSMISRTVIINSKISGVKKILGVTYEFKKMKKEFIKIGLKSKESKNRITSYYSDIDKTLIDYYYFKKKPISELLDKKNSQKMSEYLKSYPKNFRKKVMYA
ncbi:MAG: hypothetical protein PHN56_03310 [Candidatus Nanoarchaeia archaeon]|nr:hypothetical protein [Candidatus Nanoarchaeia archaeon]